MTDMASDSNHQSDAPIIELRNVEKKFTATGSIFDRPWGENASARVVCNVSLSINQGETVGLVGESGCGKSTLAKLITGELIPDSGTVLLDGDPVEGYTGRSNTQLRRIGVVFQNARESFDSRWSVRRSIKESFSREERRTDDTSRTVEALLESVNLDPQIASRYPSELSGGQLKRVALSRALAHDPAVVVLDEPVSGLDVATQATILNLLADLQRKHEIGYVFISHDLDVVRYLADRLAVMYAGEIVELGPARDVFEQPTHPYTNALVHAVPSDDPVDPPPEPLLGDPPDPLDRPTGCPFHPRCSYADKQCERRHPTFERVQSVQSRCHHTEDVLERKTTGYSGAHSSKRQSSQSDGCSHNH